MHNLSSSLRGPRAIALACITILVAASAVTSLAESYRALYEWALRRGLTGIWAAGFPAQIDVFMAVGELALFVALVDAWSVRSRYGGRATTGLIALSEAAPSWSRLGNWPGHRVLASV